MRFHKVVIFMLSIAGIGLPAYTSEAEVVQVRYRDLVPLQLGPADQFIMNRTFANRLSFIMEQISQRHSSEYEQVNSYLDALGAETQQPRQMDARELSPFVCTPRRAIANGVETFNVETDEIILASRWADQRIEGLPDSILPCVGDIGGTRYVTTNLGQNVGYGRGRADDAIRAFGSQNGSFYPISTAYRGGLAQYLVTLLTSSDSIDVKEWTRYRMADFILFQLDAGFRWPSSSNVRPEFDFNVTKVYFDTRFRALFRYASLASEPAVLFEKDYFEPNLITYDPVYNAAIGFPVTSLESIVGIIARFGRGVAYDRSGFEEFIGTFTYPWQILFHNDVNPRFPNIYRELFATAAFNDNWLIWANLIAGNGDEDTLRNSTFFRNQFRNLTVKEAVQ